MNYHFNKKLFRVWFALVLIMYGSLLINYSDYKEYDLTCSSMYCYYNNTFYDDLYLIEHDIFMDKPIYNLSNGGVLSSGEYLIYSNYETKPFLIKHFLNITLSTLLLTFLINYIWFKKEVKE